MPTVRYDKKEYALEASESVLQCLLRNNVDYPYSCKSGTCQSCLSKLTDGDINLDWQKGLKPTLKAENYFLPCVCKPENNLAMSLPNQDDVSTVATIRKLEPLNRNVIRLQLEAKSYASFRAGQFINLVTADNIVRSYSIANLPERDQYIELHIKLMPHGKLSNWLANDAQVGGEVFVRGSMGDCFYCNPDKASFPMVLAGTGTGLAPLIGISLDALAQNHCGDITLIHGGVCDDDLYFNETLDALSKQYKNFNYKTCVLKDSQSYQQASIETVLVETLSSIASEVRLFVCGPEETTNKLKTKGFLAGVPSASIYSDAFISQ